MGERLGLCQGKGWIAEESVSCTRLEDDVRRKGEIEGRHLDRLLKTVCRVTNVVFCGPVENEWTMLPAKLANYLVNFLATNDNNGYRNFIC